MNIFPRHNFHDVKKKFGCGEGGGVEIRQIGDTIYLGRDGRATMEKIIKSYYKSVSILHNLFFKIYYIVL